MVYIGFRCSSIYVMNPVMKLLLGSKISQFYGILSKIAYFHYLRALKSKS